jgi:hypothetical protein
VTVVDLLVAYAGVGALIALVAIARKRATTIDALCLLALWPLYAPVLVAGGGESADPREQALVDALRRAAGMPLAGALPDEAGARALVRRLRDGRVRLAELDRVLARADFDETNAPERRVHTIRRLRALRDRFAAELAQVDEVVTQLTAQLELVRFAGTADDTAAELAADLCARVDGLDELLGNELAGSRVSVP